MVRQGMVVSIMVLMFSAVQAQQSAPPVGDLSTQLATCATCHGSEGQGGVGDYPHLAGLGETYLRRQLDAFASGKRANAVMAPQAKALSEQQRAALARYFSQVSLDTDAGATVATVDDVNDAGRTLATEGRWEQGIPACIQCHGEKGVGIGDSFPSLAGQPERYLQDQLKAWRSGTREGGPMGLMSDIAKALSGEDLQAVAQYFSSLAPKGANHE